MNKIFTYCFSFLLLFSLPTSAVVGFVPSMMPSNIGGSFLEGMESYAFSLEEYEICEEEAFLLLPPCLDSDSLQLVAFYNAIGGDNWTNTLANNQKWLEGPVEDWYGVTLSSSGCNVETLVLNTNNLTGSLIDLDLPSLELLELRNNQLTGSIPNFTSLPALITLYLRNNQLSGEIPNFTGMPKLVNLILPFNQLSGEIPNFNSFQFLRTLYLYNNNLTGSIPNLIGSNNLKIIHLYNNNLTGSIPEFGLFTDLLSLNLANNQLSGNIPSLNSSLDLQLLNVANNQLSGVLPDFSDYPSLTTLVCQNNELTFEGLEVNKNYFDTNTELIFEYAPQASIPFWSSGDTLSVLTGGTLADNTYTWYRDQTVYTVISGDNGLVTIEPGVYRVEVSNETITNPNMASQNLVLVTEDLLIEGEGYNCLEADSLELVELYNATNGETWKHNSGWLTKPVSEWYGVSLSPLGCNVDTLILINNNLTGNLIDLDLPLLKVLELQDNQLTGSIPNFTSLPTLITLYLRNNQLSGEIPNFTGLPQLVNLALPHNQLSGPIPDFDFPFLHTLYLYDNNLTGGIPNLASCNNLKIIHLYNNSLTGPIPEFSLFTDLLSLNLSNNGLTENIPSLNNSLDLQLLNVSKNQLSGAVPDFSNFSDLGSLTCQDNQLTFEGLEVNENYFNSNSGFHTLEYAPQAIIPLLQSESTLYVEVGGNLADNTYYWYQDGVLDTTIVGENAYIVTESGNYQVEVSNATVTNSGFPVQNLILVSEELNIEVASCTDANVDLAEGTELSYILCPDDLLSLTPNESTINYGGLEGNNPSPIWIVNTEDPMGDPLGTAGSFFLPPMDLDGTGSPDTMWFTLSLVENLGQDGSIDTWTCQPLSETVEVIWLGEGSSDFTYTASCRDENGQSTVVISPLNENDIYYITVGGTQLEEGVLEFQAGGSDFSLTLTSTTTGCTSSADIVIPPSATLEVNVGCLEFDDMGASFAEVTFNTEEFSTIYIDDVSISGISVNLPIGTYEVYAINEVGCQSVIETVEIKEVETELDNQASTIAICGEGSIILTPTGAGEGGTYQYYLDEAGTIPANPSSGDVWVNDEIVGVRVIYIIATTAEGCSSLPLTVVTYSYHEIAVSDLETTCNDSDGSYTVSFNISGGSGVYTVNGASVQQTFNSAPIPLGESYSFSIDDNSLILSCESLTVSGNAPDCSPILEAVDDIASTNPGESVIIDILSNDTGCDINIAGIITNPSCGTILHIDFETGELIYLPDVNTNCNFDTFAYEIIDCQGNTTIATISIFIQQETVSSCIKADSIALINFYHATNGENWAGSSGWLEIPVEKWQGVTLTEDRCHVLRLALPNNNLSGNLPDLDLPKLERLDLQGNQITEEIPGFNNLESLTFLDLSDNQFIGFIPNFIDLPNLQNLYLNNNQLTSFVPDFAKLPILEQLDLSENLLFGEIPDFADVPQLEVLNLARNQLEGKIPDFPQLPELRELYLEENQLTGAIPEFSNLTNLQSIQFHHNKFVFADILNGWNFISNLEACEQEQEDLFFCALYAPQDTILSLEHIKDTLYVSINTLPKHYYTWYRNGVPYAGPTDEDNTLLLQQTGKYYVEVRNKTVTDSTLASQNLILRSEELNIPVLSDPSKCGGAISLNPLQPREYGLYTHLGPSSQNETHLPHCFTDNKIDNNTWFTFTGDGNTYTIGVVDCDNPLPLKEAQMAIYEAPNCDAIATPIDCTEGSVGTPQTNLTLTTVAGETYYLLVDGYEDNGGTFCIEVNHDPCAWTLDGNIPVTTLADNGSDYAPTPGSLRAAILCANANEGPNQISFKTEEIGTGFVYQIQPESPLPILTDANTTIDGSYTFNGANTFVELDGSLLNSAEDALGGFRLQGANCSIQGFFIHSFPNHGIVVDACQGCQIGDLGDSEKGNIISGITHTGVLVDAESNGIGIHHNKIGTDMTGENAFPNGTHGIHISGATESTITSNLLSGNTENGVFLEETSEAFLDKNQIGTNATGTQKLGNGDRGVYVILGIETQLTGNTISGNASDGILLLRGKNALLEGNYIGIDSTGTQKLGNALRGVWSIETESITIHNNVVSDNIEGGIKLESIEGSTITENKIGTNKVGNQALGNHAYGIQITGVLTGNNELRKNIVAANTENGIYIRHSVNTTIEDNFIGTDNTGSLAMPNIDLGVFVYRSENTFLTHNTILHQETGVLIRGNEAAPCLETHLLENTIGDNGIGVRVKDITDNYTFKGNSIHCNTESGIDILSNNNITPPPIISEATTNNTIGTAEAMDSIEVFIHDDTDCEGAPCQGKILVGKTRADDNGNWTLGGLYRTCTRTTIGSYCNSPKW